MEEKILLTTVFSAFNYGSSLQALAGKHIIEKAGYECELVKLKSLVKADNYSAPFYFLEEK